MQGSAADGLTVEIRNPWPEGVAHTTPIPGAGMGIIGLAERTGSHWWAAGATAAPDREAACVADPHQAGPQQPDADRPPGPRRRPGRHGLTPADQSTLSSGRRCTCTI